MASLASNVGNGSTHVPLIVTGDRLWYNKQTLIRQRITMTAPQSLLTTDTKQRQKLSVLAVNLGLGANILLAGLKTLIGVIGHSPALLAEGVNSTSDVAYYVVVSIFIRLARKPADEEHPYGHSQLESIAALVVGSFVIATAIAIFWNAIDSIFDLWSGISKFQGAQVSTFYVALFTVLAKLILMIVTRRIGQRTDNPAVLALAYDHRNDIFSAGAAAVGILLGRIGYTWGDPLAGALVSLVILRTGVEIVRQSSAELMDAVPSAALARQVDELVTSVPGAEYTEDVQAHRFGPYLVMNVTIGVDGSLSVVEGDEIATAVEEQLYAFIPFLRQVHVHYHPAILPGDPIETPFPSHIRTLE
jgi:cation diffusion facilitator family transporter